MIKYKGQIYPTIQAAAEVFLKENKINCRINRSTFALDDGQIVVVNDVGASRIIYLEKRSTKKGCLINYGCESNTCSCHTGMDSLIDENDDSW